MALVVAVDAVLDVPVNYSAMEHMTEQFHDREEAIRRALDDAREVSRG